LDPVVRTRLDAQDKRIDKLESKVDWHQRILLMALGAWSALIALITLGFNILTGKAK